MPPPPSIVWQLQEDQTQAHNAEGTFCLKYLSIVQMDMGFFYAFKASDVPNALDIHQPAMPDVVATSLLEIDGGSIHTTLLTRVESLGYLGAWNVGIVHIQWIDRPEQVITLSVIPVGSTSPAYSLQPLRQSYQPNEARGLYVSMYIPREPDGDEIEFYGPIMKQRIAFFRLHSNGQPATDISPIFFRIPRTHDAVTASPLTKEEFLSFAGPTVNLTTFHTGDRVRLEDAQPASILHPQKLWVSPILPPRFEHINGLEWPFGIAGGGGRGITYWHGVLKADVNISVLANHYATQLTEAKWSRIEEHHNASFVLQTWTFQDEEDAIWKGLFLIMKNPAIEQQYIFYAQADRISSDI